MTLAIALCVNGIILTRLLLQSSAYIGCGLRYVYIIPVNHLI